MSKPQVTKIATVEAPVSNLERSVKWYTELLNLHVDYKGEKEAMLRFHTHGAATVYLVETNEKKPTFLSKHKHRCDP